MCSCRAALSLALSARVTQPSGGFIQQEEKVSCGAGREKRKRWGGGSYLQIMPLGLN